MIPDSPVHKLWQRSLPSSLVLLLAVATLCCDGAEGDSAKPAADPVQEKLKALQESVNFSEQRLAKRVNDLMWFQRVSDVAQIDVVRFPGPPLAKTNNPTGQAAGLEVIVPAYTFMPRAFANEKKLPLLVLAHGGVHGDFSPEEDVHLVRELLDQGYAIIAPDYRGSTGYGRDYFEQIDYGGRENDDVLAAKQWMVANHPEIDQERVGIIGWSHGGMIALFNAFDHPKDYKVVYAGVPVSDLIARMGYKGEGYRQIFSAKNHIGKPPEDNVAEYKKRSAAWNAEKLQTPLLIHTTTNDEDVNVLEVEHLIQALKAAGKTFEYKVYTNAPGGHVFNRIDTPLARESRNEVYRFLARYLNPPRPVK